jgi:hypothetical protein
MQPTRLPTVLITILATAGIAFSQTLPSTTQPSTQPDSNPAAHITFVAVVGAGPGEEASVTIHTAAGVACSIICVTPSGKISHAKGLGDKSSDANGLCTWTWKISQHAKPGMGSITVLASGDQASTTIEFKPPPPAPPPDSPMPQ